MMELKFTQPINKSNNKNEFLINPNDKKSSVNSKKSTTAFKKVFDDSKSKSSDDIVKSATSNKQTSGIGKETSDITMVEKPAFEKKELVEDLSKEEKEKVEKAVKLLLTFLKNLFPEQKIDVEEIPTEEQTALSAVEKIAGDIKTEEQLTQVLSKELGVTIEKAQEILANLKVLSGQPELSVTPETLNQIISQTITPEKLEAMIAQVIFPEKTEQVMPPTMISEKTVPIAAQESSITSADKSTILNNQQSLETEQIPTINSDNIGAKVGLEVPVQNSTVDKKQTAESLQALQNLVEKTVDSVAINVVAQIEKLSQEQMPALQSHANFIVGKLNSDLLAKNIGKTVEKIEKSLDNVEEGLDNMVLAKTSSVQTTVNMMPLATKMGQQFADLQNNDKNNWEKSIKPLQENNQVKSNYADLLFPNKSNDVENAELNLLQDRAAITRQIVDNIKVLQRNNNTEMVIRLKPEHMGEMILRISTNASGTISASFQTNNPEARLALESTMLALKQELAANGLKVQDVDLFGGISDFLSGQSQANKDQKSNHSNKPFAEQEEKVENITDKLGEQELNTDDGNVDYRI